MFNPKKTREKLSIKHRVLIIKRNQLFKHISVIQIAHFVNHEIQTNSCLLKKYHS